METWRKCGHPRTLENSVGNRFSRGCRKCAKQNKRAYYYVHQVRVKLSDYAIIPESQWNEVISAALALGEPKALDSGNLI